MGKKAKVKVKVKKRKLKLKRIFFCLIFLCLLGETFYLAKKIPITNIYIIGNNIVPDKEIINTAKINNYPSFIDTSKKDIITRLERNDYIKEVKVEKKLPSKIYIYITEHKVISLYNNKILLDNNIEVENTYNIHNVPILISDISSIREKYTKSISKINNDVLLKISQSVLTK